MGLDLTHNCWHGPYSHFNRWREAVAAAAGIPDMKEYWRAHKGTPEQVQGLWLDMPTDPLAILFNHSDCDGLILAHHCEPLADALEKLLPQMVKSGEWARETQLFIAGLRSAAAEDQNVMFR